MQPPFPPFEWLVVADLWKSLLASFRSGNMKRVLRYTLRLGLQKNRILFSFHILRHSLEKLKHITLCFRVCVPMKKTLLLCNFYLQTSSYTYPACHGFIPQSFPQNFARGKVYSRILRNTRSCIPIQLLDLMCTS